MKMPAWQPRSMIIGAAGGLLAGNMTRDMAVAMRYGIIHLRFSLSAPSQGNLSEVCDRVEIGPREAREECWERQERT